MVSRLNLLLLPSGLKYNRLQSLFIASVIGCFSFMAYVYFSQHISDIVPDDPPISQTLNASLGFEKILLLSLPSRTDRRDAMSLAFRVSGMKAAEYIPGWRGEDIAEAAKPVGSEELKLANLGSWRAHADAWRKIIDEGWETALILEDDVDWHIEIKGQLNLVSNYLNEWRKDVTAQYPYGSQWDVFMFGHCMEFGTFNKTTDSHIIYPDPTVLPPNQLSSTDREVLQNFEVPPGHRVLSRARNPICTQGYAVTNEGAQRLLYQFSLKGVTDAVDIAIEVGCVSGRIRCLEVNPPLIGVFNPGGPARKGSDISPNMRPNAVSRKENPMGERSAKNMLDGLLGGAPPMEYRS